MLVPVLLLDLNNLIESYLSQNEKYYINKQWNMMNSEREIFAANHGCQDLLTWTLDKAPAFAPMPQKLKKEMLWNVQVCEQAFSLGHFDFVQYAVNLGFACTPEMRFCLNSRYTQMQEKNSISS